MYTMCVHWPVGMAIISLRRLRHTFCTFGSLSLIHDDSDCGRPGDLAFTSRVAIFVTSFRDRCIIITYANHGNNRGTKIDRADTINDSRRSGAYYYLGTV